MIKLVRNKYSNEIKIMTSANEIAMVQKFEYVNVTNDSGFDIINIR